MRHHSFYTGKMSGVTSTQIKLMISTGVVLIFVCEKNGQWNTQQKKKINKRDVKGSFDEREEKGDSVMDVAGLTC